MIGQWSRKRELFRYLSESVCDDLYLLSEQRSSSLVHASPGAGPAPTDNVQQRIELALQSNERFRARARSVAALCAASAGGLSAGLILSPADALSKESQVCGLVSIVFLIATTGLFVAGSVATPYEASSCSKKRKILYFLSLWRVNRASGIEASGETPDRKRLREAQLVREGISKLLGAGMWTASIATIALIAALVLAVFTDDSVNAIKIEIIDPPAIANCPGLTGITEVKVGAGELRSQSPDLELTIGSKQCGAKEPIRIVLGRKDFVIVGDAESGG